MKKEDFKSPPDYYKQRVWSMDNEVIAAGIKEIVQTVKLYLKKNPKNLDLLDAGCGEGEFAVALSGAFRTVVGVEPFKKAYEYAKKHLPKKITNVKFYNKKIEDFHATKKFDVITAITIFEHLADQKAAFDNMFSLLKKGGIIYVTAPNKYWIWEEHYALPFLSWLPLPLANRYLKLFTGVKSYKDSSYGRSYTYMKKFFSQYPCTVDFILPFDTEGAFIGCGRKGFYSVIKSFGIKLIRFNPIFWSISKGFIVVLRRTE